MFIQYTMDQLMQPMDLEEDIPQNHLVRVVNTAINHLDNTIFDAAYPGGGRDSYHPKMLTKVIIYAYTQRLYSSRQIAKAVGENIMFMWVAGRQRPDFRTLNRFRSERMKAVLETVFTSVLQFLADENYVQLDHYFVDGTKIEANAKCIRLFGVKLLLSIRINSKRKYKCSLPPLKKPKTKKSVYMPAKT